MLARCSGKDERLEKWMGWKSIDPRNGWAALFKAAAASSPRTQNTVPTMQCSCSHANQIYYIGEVSVPSTYLMLSLFLAVEVCQTGRARSKQAKTAPARECVETKERIRSQDLGEFPLISFSWTGHGSHHAPTRLLHVKLIGGSAAGIYMRCGTAFCVVPSHTLRNLDFSRVRKIDFTLIASDVPQMIQMDPECLGLP